MYRRSLSLALGMLAGFGMLAQPPMHVVAAPSSHGIPRRTTRRADTRGDAWLPGKKGKPQKRGSKVCLHRKVARNRRRAARMRR